MCASACRMRAVFLLFSCVPAEAWSGCTSLGVRHIGLVCQRKAVFMNEEPETSSDDFSRLGLADDAPPPPPAAPARYDVKKLAVSGKDEGAGAGFNQFDPVLFASGVLSRRFGILGGLAVVGALAAVEGNEILQAFLEKPPVAGDGKFVTTSSGLQYADDLIAFGGPSPIPGNVIGFNARVKIGEKVIFDTANEKPVAFKYGQRPFQNVVCEGLEEGIRGRAAAPARCHPAPPQPPPRARCRPCAARPPPCRRPAAALRHRRPAPSPGCAIATLRRRPCARCLRLPASPA